MNKAIERNQRYSRTINDILPVLAKSKYKTLKDGTSGNWHIVLDLASSLLTMFNTPWGKYRWLRLPFRLNIASDFFQERLNRVLRLLKGVHGIADNILTHGETEIQHDDMKPPQPIQTLKSLNGMVNYLKLFSPVLTELSEPLRRLQKHDTVWAWESEQQTAFEKIKTVLTILQVLTFFDKDKYHIIQTDASKIGLGTVLLQEGQPIVFASRALTDTERRYSNIESELLGVVFGLKRLHHYTFGKSITVETDHQPLTSILKKTIAMSSPRLQRLLLRLAQYDVNIEYLRGKENIIADALLRVTPLKPELLDCDTSLNNIERIPVHHITQTVPVSPERLQEIQEATFKDSAPSLLAKVVLEGWPQTIRDSPHSIQSYWYFRDEIKCEDNILYKGVRLIIPWAERASTLNVLHMRHYAIDKINLRARETVYWPDISEDIKVTYHRCNICAKFARTQQKQMLQSVKTPQSGWE